MALPLCEAAPVRILKPSLLTKSNSQPPRRPLAWAYCNSAFLAWVLDVEVLNFECVVSDEVSSLLDVVAHQDAE